MVDITLGSATYFSYISHADAVEYLAADTGAALWRAAEEDDQRRALITAARILDRQGWLGEKTDPDQANAWPRSGISDVDEAEIPQAIIDANALLAAAIIAGFDQNSQTTATKEKRVKADTVEVEYFRPDDTMAIPLPLPVWQLVSIYLGGGASGLTDTEAYGTCGTYPFANGWGVTGGL